METQQGEAAQALQEKLRNDPALEAMLAKSIAVAAFARYASSGVHGSQASRVGRLEALAYITRF